MYLVFMNGFIQSFTKYGRYADLALGLVMLALAFYWQSWMSAIFGAVSLISVAVDFNGWLQRRSIAFAQSRLKARRR